MSDKLRVGIIGCGQKAAKKGPMGYAMAYAHGDAYTKLPSCQFVACADLDQGRATEYAETFGFDGIYTDYHQMLTEANLDVLSICTWMSLHERMVLDAVNAGVKVIHCEKPMSDTWAGSVRMAEAAAAKGVQLTFNHQRRYGEPFQIARKMIADGEIGQLLRFECEFGNIYDTGTHFIDMLSFFLGDGIRAKWVLAQIDYQKQNLVFGAHCENQQTMLFEYENGVFGFVYSGKPGEESKPLGVINRIIGDKGMIDVGFGHGANNAIRYRLNGDLDWTYPGTDGHSIHGPDFIDRAIADVIDCYQHQRKCMLDASNALVATELIFGAYESSRQRQRIDFPLDPTVGNPLRDMVDAGDLKPAAE